MKIDKSAKKQMIRGCLGLVLFIVSIAGCSNSTSKTSTPVLIPTYTPRTASTATAQPTSEVETATLLPAITRTVIPTFTPATPVADANISYTLREWTPDQADLLIAQVSSRLKAVESDPLYGTVYGFAAYMEKYKYLAFAEMEALLRFPGTPQAETWRWDICFNFAFSNHSAESPNALDAYLQLWKEYPESFYTVLARSKLVPVSS